MTAANSHELSGLALSQATLERLDHMQGLQDVAWFVGGALLGDGTLLSARLYPREQGGRRGSMEFYITEAEGWRVLQNNGTLLSARMTNPRNTNGTFGERHCASRSVTLWSRDKWGTGAATSYATTNLNHPNELGDLAVVRFVPDGGGAILGEAFAVIIDGLGDVDAGRRETILYDVGLTQPPVPTQEAS